MTKSVPYKSHMIILIFIALAGIIIASVAGDGVTGLVSQDRSITTSVETPLLETLGLSIAEQRNLATKAKGISDYYKGLTSMENPAFNAAGEYLEDSNEKITTSDGKPFEGGTTITFTISPDNQVSGAVTFKFIEQGWTIKVHGTVSGFLTPDTGKLVIHSNDASVKYAGKQYPITMTVDAQYDGAGFVGTKELSMAGTAGTLGFHANPA